MRSPWVAVDPAVDSRRLAELLRRAHDRALRVGEPPSLLREVVAGSWRRAVAAGIDPERPAPRVLDDRATVNRLRRHRLGMVLDRVRPRLVDVTRDGDHLVALSDADGLLLWADGSSRMLAAAVRPRFLPGHSCNERDIGTNAVGTALALDHAVQIFSAEHFPRLLHGWTCAAAPIHDPVTGQLLGALDLSGSLRTGHADGVGLVAALARTVELELAAAASAEDERLRTRFLAGPGRASFDETILLNANGHILLAAPSSWIGARLAVDPDGVIGMLPDGTPGQWELFGGGYLVRRANHQAQTDLPVLSLEPCGDRRVTLTLGRRQLTLSPRQSEIVVLLARHPRGMEAAALTMAVYGGGVSPVTLRAEISRLRRLVGPVVASQPYRLRARVTGQLNELVPGARAPGLRPTRLQPQRNHRA